MRIMRWGLVALMVGMLAAPAVSRAEDYDLPGVSADARAYERGLTQRVPAGGTPAARRAASAQAVAAQTRQDWAAAATALEGRIALGEASVQDWSDLAEAQLKRVPADPQRALLAAWRAFQQSDEVKDQIAVLQRIAEALRRLDRPVPLIDTLAALVERAPDNAEFARQLAEASRVAGLLLRRVRLEGEADPPRACFAFTVAPSRRPDLNPQDWLRLDPPVPGAATTREGDEFCVSGLPSGAVTTGRLLAGLPGEGGVALARDTPLRLSLPNRKPRVVFDSRMFVLPRGQAPAISLSTTNLSAVALKLVRLSERNVAALLREARLGEAVGRWDLDNLAETAGSVVWEGRAEIPKWEANRPARTALPLPPALREAGPGLYLLLATPGDGINPSSAGAVQVVLRTDLAPTVWRGSDGLTVQVRRYSDATPRPGIRLALVARNNDILGETTTDADGAGRFAMPLLRGEGPLAPAALHAFGPEDDFAALDLGTAAFDLSDRGVDGMAHPGPLDAYLWLDRGIYRPGETIQLMALLRDAAGQPADIPAELRVLRPNGQVFLRTTPPRVAEGAIHLPVALSAGAAAGTWAIELRGDPKLPPIGRVEFRVDAFVPDRMAVELGAPPAMLVPGRVAPLAVTARFLYGAPAAGLDGKALLRVVVDPAPFPAWAGYRFGLEGEIFPPAAIDLKLPDTDAQGRSQVSLLLPRAPDTTQPLKAEVAVDVNDPAGRASRATTSLPVRGAHPLIGLRPLFTGNAVDAEAEAAFEAIALAPDGTRIALPARLRLVRERPDWRVVVRGALAHYETVFKDEPLESRDVTIPADGVFRLAKRLDFGRYRIELAETGGMAATSYRFRAGWAASDSPDVPDRADVSADRRAVAVGERVKIHIAAPFAGAATLLVLSDRVLSLRSIEVAAGGSDVEVPVTASWGPGAYVAVHVYRGGARPGRAIGLTWVGVDPAARSLKLAIGVPERAAPRARLLVPVTAAAGAFVSLAAVDEGILRLTRFASPDPAPHFLGRRRLGLDIRDDWGRLIAPAEGEAALLRQGGDEADFVLPDIPQRTVTLFSPPVQAGADGIARIELEIPDFNGQIRLMAVGWQGARIGAAAADVVVRDPLVAELLLPRFLAPGDTARLAVLLHNLDLPGGEAAAALSVEGPLALEGPARLAVTLAPGAQAVPATVLRATGAGRGVIRLTATGPGGFSVTRESAITVRPARPAATLVTAAELRPGGETRLVPALERFIPGSARAVASFGATVRYDAAGLMQALEAYPLACLEQVTSRGLPLALLADGAGAGDLRGARLQAAVIAVLDRQRYDGGFALWSANGEAESWLTPYATEFLLRARAAGVAVPETAVNDALKFLAEAAERDGDSPQARAAAAYGLYVLALGGQGRPGAARVMAERMAQLPTPLAKAQLGAALALAHDRPRAEAAFRAALASPARTWWSADYGSALRDQAATLVLLKESGLLTDRLAGLVAALPGADLRAEALNTQEQAWAAAAAAVLGRDGAAARIALDGLEHDGTPALAVPLDGPVTARNLGTAAVWQSLAVSGVPLVAAPAAQAGMRVTRRFLALDGSPLALDRLRQNTVFMLLLEGSAQDGQAHRAMLMQGLPAGWEIAGRIAAGKAAGMEWLGEITETEAQPAADDRFVAVVALGTDKPGFRVAVRLRAVTPGQFERPGAELADMYRPAVFARQGAGRIDVLAPE